MKVRLLSEDEQRLIQQGLARIQAHNGDRLYGQLHRVDGKYLVLIDVSEMTDQDLKSVQKWIENQVRKHS